MDPLGKRIVGVVQSLSQYDRPLHGKVSSPAAAVAAGPAGAPRPPGRATPLEADPTPDRRAATPDIHFAPRIRPPAMAPSAFGTRSRPPATFG